MELPRLRDQSPFVKWVVSVYFLLSSLGFLIAGLISHQRYDFDPAQARTYYLGNEAEMAYPKLYSQLIQVAHVHSFTMPLVFLMAWVALIFVPLKTGLKKFIVLGGALSILVYNAAPFLVRYQSGQWVGLFVIGGLGLFCFYLLPAGAILWETWLGWGAKGDR